MAARNDAKVCRRQPVGEIKRSRLLWVSPLKTFSEPSTFRKIIALRIFDDAEGKMNLSVKETGGGLLIVSQFTLYGDVRRGLRPSWSEAAHPEIAEPLYELFVSSARRLITNVASGSFRRMMQVELVNDGPVQS